MDQVDLFETATARALLSQLFDDSRLYRTGKDYKELLDFVARLRGFAPFNALLLHVQKPGLRYAASARDWHERFGRVVQAKARPLLILRPFGPVALVYDLTDTEGRPVPEDAAAFVARGHMSALRMDLLYSRLAMRNIECRSFDAGDNIAGSIERSTDSALHKPVVRYLLRINRNHTPAVQFATMAHELGHLLLGHMGKDPSLKISSRQGLSVQQQELEAESVGYLLCLRHGISPKSETYLAASVGDDAAIEGLDVWQVMRAAGRAESLLGLVPRDDERPLTSFERGSPPLPTTTGRPIAAQFTAALRSRLTNIGKIAESSMPSDLSALREAYDT